MVTSLYLQKLVPDTAKFLAGFLKAFDGFARKNL